MLRRLANSRIPAFAGVAATLFLIFLMSLSGHSVPALDVDRTCPGTCSVTPQVTIDRPAPPPSLPLNTQTRNLTVFDHPTDTFRGAHSIYSRTCQQTHWGLLLIENLRPDKRYITVRPLYSLGVFLRRWLIHNNATSRHGEAQDSPTIIWFT